MPCPPEVFLAAVTNAFWKSPNVQLRPRYVTCCERSGSYRSSSVAWVNAFDLPLETGCSGLPSILMGRNESDFTSTGTAPVGNGYAVAKYIGLPRIRSSGCFMYG